MPTSTFDEHFDNKCLNFERNPFQDPSPLKEEKSFATFYFILLMMPLTNSYKRSASIQKISLARISWTFTLTEMEIPLKIQAFQVQKHV
jgi:hypothetical protein